MKPNLTNGELAPNEIIFIEFSCIGSFTSPNSWNLKCTLYAFQENSVVGLPYEQNFTVYAECAYSELCVIPSSTSFGNILCDSQINTEFYAYNFGVSEVDFVIIVEKSKECEDNFKIEPEKGVILPGGHLKMKICGTVGTFGTHQITFKYKQFRNDEKENKNLFNINYNCQYPTFQVSQIIYFNFAFVYTKMDIWDYFKIDDLNNLFSTTKKGETNSFTIELPCHVISDKIYSVELLLENTSCGNCEINLRRIKMCDCELIEKKNQSYGRKKGFNCPHRDCLEMHLSDNVIYVNNTQILTINFKYIFETTIQMAYNIEMPNNRNIKLVFLIKGKLSTEKYLDSLSMTNEMKLQDVFIGERLAPVQLFWIINNTENINEYRIDTENVGNLCSEEGFPVITCENTQGFVQPYSTEFICVKFLPIEAKLYQISVPVKLGDLETEFLIRGNGTMQRSRNIFNRKRNRMPISSAFTSTKCPIRLSVDYLEIEPILLSTTFKTLIFIENVSDNNEYEYSFGQ